MAFAYFITCASMDRFLNLRHSSETYHFLVDYIYEFAYFQPRASRARFLNLSQPLSVYLSVPSPGISCLSYHLMFVLSSHACLIFLKAGLRPACFLITHVPLSVYLTCLGLLLASPACLTTSCLSCHLMLVVSF